MANQAAVRQYNVPALEKAVAILDLLAASDEDLSATEIHTALGIPKATAFMVLTVLDRHGIVKKAENGRYTIGVKLYELGLSYLSKLDVAKVARPHLQRLMERTSLTTHLGIMYERRMMFIDKVEPKSFIRFSTFPGMRSDIHMSSLGKAMAAYLREDEVDAIVAEHGLGVYTVSTITDRDEFAQELERVRRVGYAVENEEGELGVRCVGAPIFDSTGGVAAAVSVTGLVAQLPTDAFPSIGASVRETATLIGRDLGYAGSPTPEPPEAGPARPPATVNGNGTWTDGNGRVTVRATTHDRVTR